MSLHRSSIQDTAVRPPVKTTRHDPQSDAAVSSQAITQVIDTARTGTPLK